MEMRPPVKRDLGESGPVHGKAIVTANVIGENDEGEACTGVTMEELAATVMAAMFTGVGKVFAFLPVPNPPAPKAVTTPASK
jgi:hypothetical protein